MKKFMRSGLFSCLMITVLLLIPSVSWAVKEFCGCAGGPFSEVCIPIPCPERPDFPVAQEVANLPSLESFELVSNEYESDRIYLVFAPNGTELFNLHVELRFDNGQDILSTWCTGDESLCKAVGNGKACSGTDYTGANAWCYGGDGGEVESVGKKIEQKEKIAIKVSEKAKQVEQLKK